MPPILKYNYVTTTIIINTEKGHCYGQHYTSFINFNSIPLPTKLLVNSIYLQIYTAQAVEL